MNQKKILLVLCLILLLVGLMIVIFSIGFSHKTVNSHIVTSSQNRRLQFKSISKSKRPFTVASVTVNPSSQQASISWSTPNDNGSLITGYKITITDQTAGTVSTVSIGATSTSYTVTKLINGDSYVFGVQAVNSIGVSQITNSQPIIPAGGTSNLGPPSVFYGQVLNGKVNLYWAPPVTFSYYNNDVYYENTAGYYIYIDNVTTNKTVIDFEPSTSTFAVISGLISGDQYLFSIAGLNGPNIGAINSDRTSLYFGSSTCPVFAPPTMVDQGTGGQLPYVYDLVTVNNNISTTDPKCQPEGNILTSASNSSLILFSTSVNSSFYIGFDSFYQPITGPPQIYQSCVPGNFYCNPPNYTIYSYSYKLEAFTIGWYYSTPAAFGTYFHFFSWW